MQGWKLSLTLYFYIQILPSGLHTFYLVPVGRIVFTPTHSAVNCALLILSSEPRLCLPFILFPQEAELRSALEEMGLAWILSSVNLYFWSFCSTGRRAPAHAGRDGFSLNCLLFSFFNVLFLHLHLSKPRWCTSSCRDSVYFIKDRCLLNDIKLSLSYAVFVLACVLEKKVMYILPCGTNRSFPNYLRPLFSKWVFVLIFSCENSFSCEWKLILHMKRWVPKLASKKRPEVIQKWPTLFL